MIGRARDRRVNTHPYDFWRSTHSVHHSTSASRSPRYATSTPDRAEYLPGRAGGAALSSYRHPAHHVRLCPAYLFLISIGCGSAYAPRLWPCSPRCDQFAIAILPRHDTAVGSRFCSCISRSRCSARSVWLFYVQHQFENTRWKKRGTDCRAALHGSSYYHLPRAALVHAISACTTSIICARIRTTGCRWCCIITPTIGVKLASSLSAALQPPHESRARAVNQAAELAKTSDARAPA